MKRLEISILLGLIFCAMVSFLSFSDECGSIRGSVLRLHVLANSDSEADQALKLAVRDRILAEAGALFADSGSLAEAEEIARAHLDEIKDAAEDELHLRGSDYSVTIELEDACFETRSYGAVTLPAGKYRALRVLIGEGKGHNWWCVLFPPMCISPASGAENIRLDDVLTGPQLDIVEGDRYEISFKVVEWYEDAKKFLFD